MINPDMRSFDTNSFFSGGAGMFIQYHDIVKPVYLYAIIRMIVTKESFGLPIQIIQDMTNLSLTEWYMKRRFINPLRQLDFAHKADPVVLDHILSDLLHADSSIYRLANPLNTCKLFHAYQKQRMSFPVYVYTEQEEPYVQEDIKQTISQVPAKYVYGDLKTCLEKCDQNFTYIFSDIEMAKQACEILHGTCSHILLARDYRYNYVDHCRTFRYRLDQLARAHPFIRMGTTIAVDWNEMALGIKRLFH